MNTGSPGRDRYADDPIRLPDKEEPFDATDLEQRVESLLEAYGCSATEEGWRRLALQLAIRHREPGFEIKVLLPHRRPMEDEHLRWDEMIEAHLDPPAGTGLKRCGSVAEAARLVSKHLQREWEAGDRLAKRPPAAASLATQYSARNAGRSLDELRDTPLYMLRYLRMLSVFQAIVAAAVRVGNRSSHSL
jgi:hypothetical protein